MRRFHSIETRPNEGIDHHGHCHHEVPVEEQAAKLAAHMKMVDDLIAHIGEVSDKLEQRGLTKEEALAVSIRLHEADHIFFEGEHHGH